MTVMKADFTVAQNGVTLFGTDDGMGNSAKISRASAERARDFTSALLRGADADADGFVTTSDDLFKFAQNGISKLAMDMKFESMQGGSDMNTAGQKLIDSVRHAVNNVAYTATGAMKTSVAFKAIGNLKDILDKTNVNENGPQDIARRRAAAEASDAQGSGGSNSTGGSSSANAAGDVSATVMPRDDSVDIGAVVALPVVQMNLDRAARATSLSGKVDGVNSALEELKAGILKRDAGEASPPSAGVIGAEPMLEYGSQVIGKVADLVQASRDNLGSQATPAAVSAVEDAAGAVIDKIASVLSVDGDGAQSVTRNEFAAFIDLLMPFNTALSDAYEGVGGREERLANEVLDSGSDWIANLGAQQAMA